MRLTELRVRRYKSIDDSGWIPVDDLTCLVGRNESGKTAFMEAVERLNPDSSVDGYAPYEEYPRDDWAEYTRRHDEDPEVVASARLELDAADRTAIEATCGTDPIADPTVTVHRDYANDRHWELQIDESALPTALVEAIDLSADIAERVRTVESLSALDEETTASLEAALDGDPAAVLAEVIGETVLADRVPEFRYVGEFATMEGTIEVDALLDRREENALEPGDRVFLSLLRVAGLELEAFEESGDWRERTAELETASASVTDDAMNYWSQSGDLRIRIQAATDEETDRRLLDVRVENRDHDVTVEFEQRSHGFRRFFSTFCQLTALSEREDDVVILLDEPGASLHARAKREFLAFLADEVAASATTVYTTHSPFMIAPDRLHRTQLVDSEPLGDENVFSDVTLADEHTRFPVRNVFELDLLDTLLVGKQALLVETKADHVYLYFASTALRRAGEAGLDGRWTVVPIHDARNIDSFVGLFGDETVNVAALLPDTPPAPDRPPRRGTDDGDEDDPVRLLSEYADADGDATVEDLLSESFYVELVSRAYASDLDDADGVPDRIPPEELTGSGPLVERVREYFVANGIAGGEFDRLQPALYLQANRSELVDDLDRRSRRRFNRLFTDLNNTLESFDDVQSRSRGLFDALGI